MWFILCVIMIYETVAILVINEKCLNVVKIKKQSAYSKFMAYLFYPFTIVFDKFYTKGKIDKIRELKEEGRISSKKIKVKLEG